MSSGRLGPVIPNPKVRGSNPPHGKLLYVPNAKATTISIVDVAKRKVIRTLPGGKSIMAFVPTPDWSHAWATAPAEDRIFKLDLKRRVKVADVAIPGEPHGMALSPDGNLLFIVQRKLNQVVMMDTNTNKIIATRKVGKRLGFITTSPDGKFVFVTSRGEDKMYKLTVGDLGIKGSVATGKQPHGIACRP